MKLYPKNLDSSADGSPVDRISEIAAYKARLAQTAVENSGPLFGPVDLAGSVLLTVVLWFGVFNDIFFPRAARPSDLVVPALGRALGMQGEQWLDDFENGSRGELPMPVLALSLSLFFAGGVLLEQALKASYGGGTGGAAFTVQLGFIGCIWAGVYEVGRLDTGDALRSRAEDDERDRVFGEFVEFADERLERCSTTTSTNQVEIVRLFRRSYSRHRREDQDGSASNELIAECLRYWHQQGYGRSLMKDIKYGMSDSVVSQAPPPTSSGFYKGLKIKATYESLNRL
eukprot:CAMPEP_0172624814 /NCGR_PEP_ID=MMETSP1068-20121228/139403_1 /TAXON_ID=35684 /ORGANISM="Pseudopedinella elastica, Strain CCMP716" /LENGTH=285 /DNA_ID=CAMNT_0013433897 /DNA_START=317 /DNA_END=1174 /DNA_ORIENTATION=-